MNSVADQQFTSNVVIHPTAHPTAKFKAAMTARGRQLRPQGGTSHKWRGQCPRAAAHEHGDRRPSLSVTWDDNTGRLLVHCFAGCRYNEILDALGLTGPDLFLHPRFRRPIVRTPVATTTFDYSEDEHGVAIRARKVRIDYNSDGRRSKECRWQHERNGKWRHGLNGVHVGLFNIAAVQDAPLVFGCEGEQKAVAITNAGMFAVSVPHGAGGGWRDSYTASLRRAAVGTFAVIPDADRAGWRLAQQTLHACHGHFPVRLVRLPGVPRGGDVVDFFNAGHDASDLRRLVADAPDWTPARDEQERDERRQQQNRERQRRFRERHRRPAARGREAACC